MTTDSDSVARHGSSPPKTASQFATDLNDHDIGTASSEGNEPLATTSR
ncbi:hypothetical protein [Natrinema pellirubrum]|nr:hypothetical protein [Natrinema pellirubrum]